MHGSIQPEFIIDCMLFSPTYSTIQRRTIRVCLVGRATWAPTHNVNCRLLRNVTIHHKSKMSAAAIVRIIQKGMASTWKRLYWWCRLLKILLFFHSTAIIIQSATWIAQDMIRPPNWYRNHSNGRVSYSKSIQHTNTCSENDNNIL